MPETDVVHASLHTFRVVVLGDFDRRVLSEASSLYDQWNGQTLRRKIDSCQEKSYGLLITVAYNTDLYKTEQLEEDLAVALRNAFKRAQVAKRSSTPAEALNGLLTFLEG